MAVNSIPQLIDMAYRAAAAPPQAWQELLGRVMGHFGALNGTLWHQAHGEFLSRTVISPNPPDPQTQAEMIACDPYLARQQFVPLARGVLGQQLVPLRQFRRTRHYTDFGRHTGGVHLLGSILLRDRNSLGAIALFRADRSQPFDDQERERLDALAPHLRRAAQIAERLRSVREQLDGSAAALYGLDRPVLLLDARQRIVFANAPAEQLLRTADPLCAHAGRLRLRFGDERPLRSALTLATQGGNAARRGQVLCLPRRDDPRGLVVTISPLWSASALAADLPDTPQAVVFLSGHFGVATATAESLRRRFGFTPAEAQLAVALCEGQRLAAYAADHGISVNTARTQLRALLRKTRTRRQAELIGRLLD